RCLPAVARRLGVGDQRIEGGGRGVGPHRLQLVARAQGVGDVAAEEVAPGREVGATTGGGQFGRGLCLGEVADVERRQRLVVEEGGGGTRAGTLRGGLLGSLLGAAEGGERGAEPA